MSHEEYEQGPKTHEFAIRMRELRQELGWSAETLAQYTGIPRAIFANLETRRRRDVTLDEAFTIAEALGTTVYHMVGLDPVRCVRCKDQIPVGFTCNSCRKQGEA